MTLTNKSVRKFLNGVSKKTYHKAYSKLSKKQASTIRRKATRMI